MNRSQLIQYLRNNALNAPTKEDVVPYIAGVKRGKPFIPKVEDLVTAQEHEHDFVAAYRPITTEDVTMCELLDEASLGELREIADILGVMYQDDCKAEDLTVYPEEELENNTCVDDIIARIEANDEVLTCVTLNNVKHINAGQWHRLFKALAEVNTNVEWLHLANCNLTDHQAPCLVRALSQNGHLRVLTLDSNMLSGSSLVKILKAVSVGQSLREIRLNNQVLAHARLFTSSFSRFFCQIAYMKTVLHFLQQLCKRLGHQIELDIVNIIEDCPQLLRLGLSMEFRDPLNRVAGVLQRNLSNHTKNNTHKC